MLISPSVFAADQYLEDTVLTIPYDANYRFGRSSQLSGRSDGPWLLDLRRANGEQVGNVSLRETPEGILIFGRLVASRPNYASSLNEISARDHMGLWLSVSERVEMPDLGWGNQHGLMTCGDSSDPAIPAGVRDRCQSWEAEQLEYRQQ